MPGFELFGESEKKSVQEVLDTGVLMRYGFDGLRQGHWKALELESSLAQRMNTRYAQLVSSGTAALSTALVSAGVGAGEEVILPVFTFVASFEAVLSVGAVPVLCDIDDTLTLDPKAVRSLINSRTRVIMPVHMCGSMARMDELLALARENDLILIEDACQAIGGSYKGRPLGSLGDMGCFSFDYVKIITCGEGGAIITDNETFYQRADHFSDHGHDHIGTDRGAESHPFLGYNFRISELNAAVGVAQLKRLDEFLEIQKRNYTVFREALSGYQGLTFRTVPDGGEENYSFLNFFLPNEKLTRTAADIFKKVGLDGIFYWFDNNWHYHRKWEHLKMGSSLGALPEQTLLSLKDQSARHFPASDQWMGRCLSVLIKLGWSTEEVERRAQLLKKVIGELL